MNKHKEKLLQHIDNFPEKKIVVWGDFILDEYLYGTTRRISREAPVLIISYKDKQFSLGGGGNSTLNLKSLGADPIPVGILGKDEAGEKTLEILRKNNIPTDYMILDEKFSTPIKTRILAGEEGTKKQQILRIDREEKVPDSPEIKERIKNTLKKIRDQSQALLISDYDYRNVKEDIFAEIRTNYQENNIPIMLDSRFRLLHYKGITIATPNEPEVEAALNINIRENDQILNEAGSRLLQNTQAEAVLITRGSRGMVLFEKNKDPFTIPIFGTTDIVDMTGAGDTVISVISIARASGSSFQEAALLANYAGGIVVMKKGTATLTLSELKEAIESEK